jgi:hypothetical protein
MTQLQLQKNMFPCCFSAPYNFKEVFPTGEILGSQGSAVRVRFVLFPFDGSKEVLIYAGDNESTLLVNKSKLEAIRNTLKMNVCSFDYPADPTETHVNAAFSLVYTKLAMLKLSQNVHIWSRGIGTGPSIWLAAQLPSLKSLVLINAYKSIKEMAAIKAAAFVDAVPNWWNNKEAVKKLKCKVLFLHAKNNSIIPFEHSQTLFDNSVLSVQKNIIAIESKDHVTVDEINDIIPVWKKFVS